MSEQAKHPERFNTDGSRRKIGMYLLEADAHCLKHRKSREDRKAEAKAAKKAK